MTEKNAAIKKIYVIAGEASGDLHGANLIHHLKTLSKNSLEIYGVGGDKIKATGALNFFDLAHFHVTGFVEALKHIPQYKEAARVILSDIEKTKPDVVVLIDNPGFNLHLAQKIHALSIPVVYYIAPQIWAWAPKRVFKIKKFVKKVLVVFEFEKKIYEDHAVPVQFVGHPLKDILNEIPSDAATMADKANGHSIVCLLPGSRKHEVAVLLPILLKSAEAILKKRPKSLFKLIKSPTLPVSFYETLLAQSPVKVELVQTNSYSVIKSSDLALVCSGTATLECALLNVPMIITNKGTLLTYLLARCLIRVSHVGLPNLILNQRKFPELLQYDATPEKISRQAIHLLADTDTREVVKRDLAEISKRLGDPGASQRAAQEILKSGTMA